MTNLSATLYADTFAHQKALANQRSKECLFWVDID